VPSVWKEESVVLDRFLALLWPSNGCFGACLGAHEAMGNLNCFEMLWGEAKRDEAGTIIYM
jgi:hypothetical protein